MPVTNDAASTPTRSVFVITAFLFFLINSPLFASDRGLSHTVTVDVAPDTGTLSVRDEIRTDRPFLQYEFVLNAGLTVRTNDGELRALGTSEDGLRTTYRITLQTANDTLELHYRGKPVFSARRSLGDMPQGIIAAEGVYLDGASAWYPRFARDFDALHMTVKLPEGWESVSIGRRGTDAGGVVTWSTDQPHDDLYLIAGRYTRYVRSHGGIDLSVWLLDDDPALAGHYLGVMGDYIDHYSRLIGPYPYAKFAVVENRWQTGFGMPSFTLLGSRVMRLPFIPYTSLPHEILHNWWGNGVWIDYDGGNWSEGLTAYLADHWMQERQGKGDQYRLKALQNYSNFAARGEDSPLLDFVSRHNDSTQSIGYSKSLMVFHMLRNRLGDAGFTAGLQRLWQQHRHQRVGFAETLGTIAGDAAVAAEFAPWLARRGAPDIRLDAVAVRPLADGWQLDLDIRQSQDTAFTFDLPVLITLADQAVARREVARIDGTSTRLSYRFAARPLRIDIDPGYDVLRQLDPTEQPPALNRLFGGEQTWLVLPTAADNPMRSAWASLARAWQARYPGLRTIDDRDAENLDPRADRVLLGWDNALLAGARSAFARDDQSLDERGVTIGGERHDAGHSGVVLVSSDARGVTTGFIGAASPQAIESLAGKLTHYGSYGRLLFDADGRNLLRDSLSSSHSRLSRQLGEQPVPLRMPPRSVLGESPLISRR